MKFSWQTWKMSLIEILIPKRLTENHNSRPNCFCQNLTWSNFKFSGFPDELGEKMHRNKFAARLVRGSDYREGRNSLCLRLLKRVSHCYILGFYRVRLGELRACDSLDFLVAPLLFGELETKGVRQIEMEKAWKRENRIENRYSISGMRFWSRTTANSQANGVIFTFHQFFVLETSYFQFSSYSFSRFSHRLD